MAKQLLAEVDIREGGEIKRLEVTRQGHPFDGPLYELSIDGVVKHSDGEPHAMIRALAHYVHALSQTDKVMSTAQSKNMARVGMEGVRDAFVQRFETLASVYEHAARSEHDTKFAQVIRSQLDKANETAQSLMEIVDK